MGTVLAGENLLPAWLWSNDSQRRGLRENNFSASPMITLSRSTCNEGFYDYYNSGFFYEDL